MFRHYYRMLMIITIELGEHIKAGTSVIGTAASAVLYIVSKHKVFIAIII